MNIHPHDKLLLAACAILAALMLLGII